MQIASFPENEKARLEALKKYEILDTDFEKEYDEIVHLASLICETPIALLSLIDAERQWFKAKEGLGANETHRNLAFCAHAIHHNELFIVPDASQDERFADNPLVTGNPDIRFYAGKPLTTPEGFNIGTLCAIDTKPRILSETQKTALETLGNQIIAQLELRLKMRELEIVNRDVQERNDELLTMEEELKQNLEELQTVQEALEIQKDEIERQSAFHEAILENSALMIITTDTEGIITTFNPAAEKALGYQADELLNKQSPAIFHDLDEIIERAKELSEEFNTKVEVGFEVFVYKTIKKLPNIDEWTYVRKNGQKFPVNLSITSLRQNDKIIGFIGIAEDISDRRRHEALIGRQNEELISSETELRQSVEKLHKAKEALQINASRMQGLLDSQNNYVVRTDLNGCYTYANRRFIEIFGAIYAAGNTKDLIGLSSLDSICPEDHEKVSQAIMDLLNTGKAISGLEIRKPLPNQQTAITLWDFSCIHDEVGNPTEIQCIGIDFTERKKAEERIHQKNLQLANSEEELKQNVEELRSTQENLARALADNQAITEALDNSALVSIADLKGDIIKVNSIFCEISGYSEEELLGQNHRIVNSGYHSTAFWVEMWKTISQGKTWRAEVCNRSKNGDLYWVDTVINPVYDAEDKIYQYLSIRNLVTERKKAEESLRQSELFQQRIFAHSPVPMVIMDVSTFQYIDCNEACVQVYGFGSKEATLGKTPLDVSAPIQYDGTPSPEKAIAYINQAIQDGYVTFEWLHQRPDGSLWDADVYLLRFNLGERQFFQFSLIDKTERKKAEDELVFQKSRMDLTLKGTGVGIWQWDIVKNVVTWDDQMYALYGIQRADFGSVYEAWLAGVHPQDQDFCNKAVQDTVENGTKYDIDFRVVLPNKEIRYTKASGEVIRDSEGKPLFMLGINMDITERKKAEQEILKQQKDLLRISQIAKVGGLEYDVLNNKLTWTTISYDIHELPYDFVLVSDNAINFYKEGENRQKISEAFQQAIEKGEEYDLELIIVTAKGKELWVRAIGEPIFEEGKCVKLIGVFQDIHEQKLADEKIETSQKQLQNFFDLSIDFMTIANIGGYFEVINPTFERELGYTKEELLSQQFLNLVHQDDIESTLQEVAKLSQGALTIGFENRYKKKNGEYIWLSWRTAPDPQTGKLFANARNVTEAKKITQLIQEQNTKLLASEEELKQNMEQLASQRDYLNITLEELKISQNQMVRSEKLAVMGKLVASVAHEINTPLGAIQASVGNMAWGLQEALVLLPQIFQILNSEEQKLFFEMVELALQNKNLLSSKEERQARKKLEAALFELSVSQAEELAYKLSSVGFYEKLETFLPLFEHPESVLIVQIATQLINQRKSVRTIQSAIEKASKVVFALKTYARHDQNNEKMKTKISESLETVLTLYHGQMKHSVEVERHYEETPEIWCYVEELNQVWTNLIHNALQAMKQKGSLGIGLKQVGNSIEVSVTDTGMGIPKLIQDRIFEPFFTTKPTGEGSGLGLDIVRKIVEKHEGQIWFETQEGIGTTFFVRLPIQE